MLMFIACVGFWVASYHRILKVSFPVARLETVDQNAYPQGRSRRFGVDSYIGRLHLIASKIRAFPNCDSGDYGIPAGIRWDHYELPVQSWECLGFAGFDGYDDLSAITSTDPIVRYRSLVIPYWFLAIAFSLPLIRGISSALQARRRLKRSASGLCSSCGYNLRATPHACPECGSMAGDPIFVPESRRAASYLFGAAKTVLSYIRRRKRRTVFACGILLLLPYVAFQSAVRWWTYPANQLRAPAASSWITDRSGNPLAQFVDSVGDWSLPLNASEISPHLLQAMVAVEDQRFYQHGGVDWRSVASALSQDVRALRFRRGASTITMQLEHLRQTQGHQNQARSLVTKIVQAIRAEQIEHQQNKQQILVEYLNRAPFGGNLTGAGAASWKYFAARCSDLTLGQAALLAGLPQNPNRLRPDRFPLAAKARRDHVLQRMFACGFITENQRSTAASEPVAAVWKSLSQEAAEQVELAPTLVRLQMEHPGRTLRTTIDSALQRQAAVAAQDQLNSLSASHVTAAAVVVLKTDSAECLAAVSRTEDRGAGQNNLDLTARPRSSGSTLKPLIYAAAFDAGICTPQTMLNDSPVAWSGYEPSNYDRDFAGPIRAADALAQSRNIPALVLLSKVGVDNAVGVMRNCGLATLSRTPDRFGLSLVVGGAEVTPMELAQAYATLARGGVHLRTTLTNTAFIDTGQPSILRRASCLATLQCIASPDRTARLCPEAVELAPAWKTGTSSGHRDAWCAAVTPRFTVVVWLGNIDGSGSDALIGQDAAAPLALHLIAAIDRPESASFATFAPSAGFSATVPPASSVGKPQLITMLSPLNREKILIDSSLPADQRRVALRARLMNESDMPSDLFWVIDGQCIGVCHNDEIIWWQPEPGPHDVRVTTSGGLAAVASVEVAQP